MTVSYDEFTEAFLAKITEYNFVRMYEEDRQALIDGYMKRVCAHFNEVCLFDLTNGDDEARTFEFVIGERDATQAEVDEIVDIVSDGMVFQWLRQYVYKQENLENMLNTGCVQRCGNAA